VKNQIMEALGITSYHGWYHRLHGRTIPNIEEYRKIETIFAQYGITDIWG